MRYIAYHGGAIFSASNMGYAMFWWNWYTSCVLSNYQCFVWWGGWGVRFNETLKISALWLILALERPTTVRSTLLNTLRTRQNGRHIPDDNFKCTFFNENVWISITISLKFVPKVRINNLTALVLIMAWRRPGDKPLSEPMPVRSLTHICVTRHQWVEFWLQKLQGPLRGAIMYTLIPMRSTIK